MDAKVFGTFIAECRKEINMTQAELAVKLNVTDKAVSRWERGVGFPDISTIGSLASALNLSVLEIMKSKKEEKRPRLHVTNGYFRPHTVTLTKEGMAQLPESLRKHAEDGGKLWLVKDVTNGTALIADSKTGEGVCVNGAYVVWKLRVNPECYPYMSEAELEHIRNGGSQYMIGLPVNGKILVSNSPDLDGDVVMEDYVEFADDAETEYPEIAAEMAACVVTIRKCNEDMDSAKCAGARLYNYLTYCLILPELDDLTSMYRDLPEDNVIGYNPRAVCMFVGTMRSKYPKEETS